MRELNRVLNRLRAMLPDRDTRNHEEPCPRCDENPCACGQAEYEAWLVSEELKAQAEGKDQ
jgi:hypothetical protein